MQHTVSISFKQLFIYIKNTSIYLVDGSLTLDSQCSEYG